MTKSKTLRVQMVAAVTAMLLVSFMVVRTSSAAFSGSADGGSDTFSASTVYFDDIAGGTDFSIGDGLVPGDLVLDCVTVTYSGTELDGLGTVELSIPDLAGTDGTTAELVTALGLGSSTGTDLTDALVSVVMGDSAADDCTALEGALDTDYTDGVLGDSSLTADVGAEIFNGTLASLQPGDDTGWKPASSSDSRSFAIRILMPLDLTDQYQGDSVAGTFTWQVDAGASS